MATQHVALDYERLENHCNIFSIPSCGTERLQPDPRLSPGNEVEGSEALMRGAKKPNCYTEK